jgi:hypothetical protein
VIASGDGLALGENDALGLIEGLIDGLVDGETEEEANVIPYSGPIANHITL